MPTRSTRKRIARIQKRFGPNIVNAWERFLHRHRTNDPSTRRTRRKYASVIRRTLKENGYVVRPEDLNAEHAACVMRASQGRGLSPGSVRNIRSTLNWIGGILDCDLFPKVTDTLGRTLSKDRLRAWMDYVRNESPRTGSCATRKTRQSHLRLFVRTIHDLGYDPKPENVRPKHLAAALAQWAGEGVSRRTTDNRLSTLRYYDCTADYEELLVKRNAPRWIRMLLRYGYITPSDAQRLRAA